MADAHRDADPVALMVQSSVNFEAPPTPFNREKLKASIASLHTKEFNPETEIERLLDTIETGLPDGVMTTADLLQMVARMCDGCAAFLGPHMSHTAGKLWMRGLKRRLPSSVFQVACNLFNHTDARGNPAPLIREEIFAFFRDNASELQAIADKWVDVFNNNFTLFGAMTLQGKYLMSGMDGKTMESPVNLYLRIAVEVHGCHSMKDVEESVARCARKEISYASPTCFNAGSVMQQMSSCYLMSMFSDSIDGIYRTKHLSALVSKSSGGQGTSIDEIRARGSWIRSSNGTSNGLIPMLKTLDEDVVYVDQGGGKRKGAHAIYVPDWHFDALEVLVAKDPETQDDKATRNLFYGFMLSDALMDAVNADGMWSLFDPNECHELSRAWGNGLKEAITRYNAEAEATEAADAVVVAATGNPSAVDWSHKPRVRRRRIPAVEFMRALFQSSCKTGTPYIIFGDNAQRLSPYSFLGKLKNSNLCTEIIELCGSPLGWREHDGATPAEQDAHRETAVCNLISIGLPAFVDADTKTFDHAGMHAAVKFAEKSCDRIIDKNFYPDASTRRSNMRHRPIGLGVQGMADVFQILGMPYDSPQARRLSDDIFQTLYHGALEASNENAKKNGAHVTFSGATANHDTQALKEWEATEAAAMWGKLGPSLRESGAFESLAPPTAVEDRRIEKAMASWATDGRKTRWMELSADEKADPSNGYFAPPQSDSPHASGELQFDRLLKQWKSTNEARWNALSVEERAQPLNHCLAPPTIRAKYDWMALKKNIRAFGLRHLVHIAPMPTASTAQILGNNVNFEPMAANIFSRNVLAGEFIVVNIHLFRELFKRGLWTSDTTDMLRANRGSVLALPGLPDDVKDVFRTIWEYDMIPQVNMQMDRGKWVDQSSSFNVHVAEPDFERWMAMMRYAHTAGIITAQYYLYVLPALENRTVTVAKASMGSSIAPRAPLPACMGCDAAEGPLM